MKETLEEVVEKLFPVFNRSTPFGSKYPWVPRKEREAFKRGVKWQQEISYSEDEAGELVYNILGEYAKHYGIMIDGSKLNELFKQFKNK